MYLYVWLKDDNNDDKLPRTPLPKLHHKDGLIQSRFKAKAGSRCSNDHSNLSEGRLMALGALGCRRLKLHKLRPGMNLFCHQQQNFGTKKSCPQSKIGATDVPWQPRQASHLLQLMSSAKIEYHVSHFTHSIPEDYGLRAIRYDKPYMLNNSATYHQCQLVHFQR